MTDEPKDVQAIIQRIDALERQNRWLIWAGLVASLLAVAAVTMGQTRPGRTVEAEQFILRDASGRQRLTIGTPRFSGVAVAMEPDEPAIWIVGTNGVDRAILTGDGLRWADEHGKPRVSIETGSNLVGPMMHLFNSDGKERLRAEVIGDHGQYVSSGATDSMVLNATDLHFVGEGSSVYLSNSPNGSLTFNDVGHNKATRGIMTLKANSLSLTGLGENIAMRGTATLDANSLTLSDWLDQDTISLVRKPHNITLNLIDLYGFKTVIGKVGLAIPSTGESRETSAASLVLFGKDGKVIWSAP